MEVVHLSDGLSSQKVMHVLYSAESDVGGRGHDGFSSEWGLGGQVVDFEDYTNVLLWCDHSCVTGFLHRVGVHVCAVLHVGFSFQSRLRLLRKKKVLR